MSAEQHILKIKQQTIAYTVKRSNRRRSMAIQVAPEGVSVAAPQRASHASIVQLVSEHAGWIEKKLAQFAAIAHLAPPAVWNNHTTIYYLGDAYPVKIVPALLSETECYLQIDAFRLVLPVKPVNIQQVVTDLYQAQAVKLLTERVAIYQRKLEVNHRQLTIANQKTRWGSCDHKGNIRLNWRLIMLPLPLLDYVIVHELCHLVHLNHSGAFWELVATIFPDYRQRRASLNQKTAVFGW